MASVSPKASEGFTEAILSAAETVANWFHAAPQAGAKEISAIPSRHRLYNATGGIVGWLVARHLMNIMVGETPKGKKIEKEKLPFFLQPLHGILAYNRYADDAKNQWMRVFDDLSPAVFGAVGAVLGSQYFFLNQEDALAQSLRKALSLGPKAKLPPAKNIINNHQLDLRLRESVASLQQAKTWRVLSGISGIFASTSGLALLPLPFNFLNYGVSLNKAFILAAGRKEAVGLARYAKRVPVLDHLAEGLRRISGARSNTVYGPGAAISAMISGLSQGGEYHGTGINARRLEQYVNAILKPWFKDVTPGQIETFKNKIASTIESQIRKGGSPQAMSANIQNGLKALLDGDKLAATLKEAGLNPANATVGSNGLAGWFGRNPGKTAGMLGGAVAAGIAGNAMAGDKKGEENVRVHPASPFGENADAQPAKAGNASPGFVNGPLLRFGRWLSDSVINVPPQNRFFSAVGLSLGLFVGYRGMRILGGREFSPAKPLGKMDISPIWRWMHGKFKFDYYADANTDRAKRVIFWVVPTITGAIGTYFGSKFAFRNYYKELNSPDAQYMEDYSAKIAMAQGDKWGILSATSAILASSSGMSNFPIPGMNYSIGLSTNSVLRYDKRVSMPGLNRFWSGNSSTYYMGLKGLLEYTIKYATLNPSHDPKELVPLADATLRPNFPQVTDEQLAHYVEKIEAVRKKYWKEGEGIPKQNQKAAEGELRAMLRGAGYEKTLLSIGLDPANAVFNNGAAGKIADAIGAKSKVQNLAQEYQKRFAGRKAAYQQEPQPQSAQKSPASLTAASPLPDFTRGSEQPMLKTGGLASMKPFAPDRGDTQSPAQKIIAAKLEKPLAAPPTRYSDKVLTPADNTHPTHSM